MIPLPNAATVRLGALVVVIAGAGFAGWTARGWKEDAARLEAERTAHATYVATVEGWAAAVQVIDGLRAGDRQQADADRIEFDRRIKHATRPQAGPLVVCGPVLVPDGMADLRQPVRFTADFIGLWNDALDIGLPEVERARSGHRADTAAGLPAGR